MPVLLTNTEFDRFVQLEEKCAGKKNPPKCDSCPYLKDCKENHDRYAELYAYDTRKHRQHHAEAIKNFDELRHANYTYKGPRKPVKPSTHTTPRPTPK